MGFGTAVDVNPNTSAGRRSAFGEWQKRMLLESQVESSETASLYPVVEDNSLAMV